MTMHSSDFAARQEIDPLTRDIATFTNIVRRDYLERLGYSGDNEPTQMILARSLLAAWNVLAAPDTEDHPMRELRGHVAKYLAEQGIGAVQQIDTRLSFRSFVPFHPKNRQLRRIESTLGYLAEPILHSLFDALPPAARDKDLLEDARYPSNFWRKRAAASPIGKLVLDGIERLPKWES